MQAHSTSSGQVIRSILLAVFFLFATAFTAAGATLTDAATPFTAGPVNPQNGFALYVQDSGGLALELCLDSVDGQGTPPPCFFDPVVVGNPFSEQIGFGAEGFWWAADASIDEPSSGLSAILVQAVEAAFLAENPVNGEQFPFTRLRIRVDVPQPGIYTVTHPYGQESYLVESVGPGFEVRESFDIEFINNALNQGRIAPFLRWDNSLPAPPAGYIGDAATLHSVTGSPLGTNLFSVEGVDFNGAPIPLDADGSNLAITDQFIVMGKIYTGAVPSPLAINRTSYARDINGQVDIFATSAPTASVSVSGGANLPTGETPLAGDGSGRFFAHIPLGDASTLPATVDVTATNPGNIATLHKSLLVDQVMVTRAEYDTTNGLLIVEAQSSDQVANPALDVVGLGTAPLSLAIAAPPAELTVLSDAGGSATVATRVTRSAVPTNLPPVAVDDSVNTNEDTALTLSPLDNDFDPNDPPGTFPPSGSIDVTSLAVGTAPIQGNLVNNGDGSLTYTPAAFFNGSDQFSYTVRDNAGAFSNVATVSINVIGVNNPPVAVDDLAAVNVAGTVNIAVLANDTDADNNLDPTSVVILSAPASGSASVLADGSIDFTAGPAPGAVSFSYQVSDTAGATSNAATVTITVSDILSETLTVQRALFRSGRNEWRIEGTSSVPGPGNSIEIFLGPDTLGTQIGSADVGALGAWRFRETGSVVDAGGFSQVTIRSSGGTTLTAPLLAR